MKEKTVRGAPSNFGFRARMGEYEVEISGSREEVLKTIEELPSLMGSVCKAFEIVKPKTVATLTVRKEPVKEESVAQQYPKIVRTENSDEAVVRILETDWGKWRPRTVDELKEALKASGLDYSGSKFTAVLARLVKEGKVRRWNTDSGYVYILAEKEAST
ncbi:MAG TPA: hypothetical protein VIH48_00250 [Candidatus Bathyarchaeia archaeon]